MAEIAEIRKRAIVRLDIVQLYMMRNMAVTMFANLYNAGDISRQLLEESGPIEAEDLDRWADICMGGRGMNKRNFTLWFLRRFLEFRELEEGEVAWTNIVNGLIDKSCQLKEKAKSDAALIESLNRYIEALEGKAAMQAEVIQKLNTLLAMTGSKKEESNG